MNFASKNLCEYLFLYLFIPTARHVFRVSSVDAEGGHSHTLQAPNEEEKKQWLNAIRSVIPSPENYKTYLWCHAIISQITLHLGRPPWQLRKLCGTDWTSKAVRRLCLGLLSCACNPWRVSLSLPSKQTAWSSKPRIWANERLLGNVNCLYGDLMTSHLTSSDADDRAELETVNEGQISRTDHCINSILACSQTLYFLFKVRRARVIKYKSQGIYWPPAQGGSGGGRR